MRKLIVFALFFCSLGVCHAVAQAPVLFYSDLTSGPATGGEGGTNGAYACIYGERFGSTQGSATISVGGVNASAYKVWSDSGAPYLPGHYAKACFQVAAATPSGLDNIVLTTAAGSSGTLPFTVRSGNVYFVSTTGNDSTGTGSYSSPWATTNHAISKCVPGDTVYVENGVVESTVQSGNTAVNMKVSGTAGNPVMVGAYPGATIEAIVNGTTGTSALTDYVNGVSINHWGIFGWLLVGNSSVSNGSLDLNEDGGTDVRIVDNTVECTGSGCTSQGSGFGGAFHTYVYAFGNRIQSVGCHEDLPGYTSSAHPCHWITPSTTITTSGTTATLSGYTSGFAVGDVIRNPLNSEMHEIIALVSGQVYTLDTAFTVDLPSGSAWNFRDFVPNKEFHNVYFSTNSDDIWFEWNEVDGSVGHAFRGIQFFSTINNGGGAMESDLHVVNNYIHDTYGDCINFATVDPSSGPVEAYNNLLSNCGVEPYWYPPGDMEGSPAFCQITQAVQAFRWVRERWNYNNSCYGFGSTAYPQTSGGSTTNGAQGAVDVGILTGSPATPNMRFWMANNIFVPTASSQNYVSTQVITTPICQTGTVDPYCTNGQSENNDWYGSTAQSVPSYTANNLNANPLWVNPSTSNFHLQSGSPAIGAGVATATTDADGNVRTDPPAIGAFEYESNSTSSGTQVTVSATPNPVIPEQPVTVTVSVAQTGSSVPCGQHQL